MILYLDTSALVKLYVEEGHSAEIRAAVAEAEAVSTHAIAYAETKAALARLHRENRLSDAGLAGAKASFSADWTRFVRVQALEALLHRAGDLAELLALRGYDSVHLAAGEYVRVQSGASVIFACFDERLRRAAALLGMSTLPESRPKD